MAQSGQKSITAWNILDQMDEVEILNDKGTKHLKEALSIAAELRLVTYSNNLGNKNKELLLTYIPFVSDLDNKDDQQLLEKAFYFKDIFLIRHFYQVMLRVQDLVKALCDPIYNNQAEFTFKTDQLYLDDVNTINLINTKFPIISTQIPEIQNME